MVKEYTFEIQTLINLTIKNDDKETARSMAVKDLQEGKFDEELRKFATISIGREIK